MNRENSVYEYKWELVAINKEQKVKFKYIVPTELVCNILREVALNEMGDEIEISEEIYDYIKNHIEEDFIKDCIEKSNMINEAWLKDLLNNQYDKVDTKKLIYLLEKIEEYKK